MNIRLFLSLALASATFSSLPIVHLPAGYNKEECVCSDESCSSLSCCDQNNSNCIYIPLCPAFEEIPQETNLQDAWFNALESLSFPLYKAVKNNQVPEVALQNTVLLLSNPEVFTNLVLQENLKQPALAFSATREFLVAVQSLGNQQFNGDFMFYDLAKEVVASLIPEQIPL